MTLGLWVLALTVVGIGVMFIGRDEAPLAPLLALMVIGWAAVVYVTWVAVREWRRRG
jgi:hypothetical protein